MTLPEGKVIRSKLKQYLESDSDFRAVFEYTRERFEAARQLTAHNWEHVYRDTINAIVIGEAEGADMHVVLPAMVMHDIGYLYGADGKVHEAVGAEKLPEYLAEAHIKLSDSKIEQIAPCIRTHKGSMRNEQPESKEAKVVSDSDLLDKFGPIGVYQGILVFSERYQPTSEYIARAIKLTTGITFQTRTGTELAKGKEDFTTHFGLALAEAYEPYRTDDIQEESV